MGGTHFSHPRYAPKKGLRQDLKSTDLAWFAGFVDGEGCLGIYPNGDKYGRRFVGRLIVFNTDILPIEAIAGFYTKEAGIRFRKTFNKCKPHWRPIYRLEVQQQVLLDTLSALLPYLKNKQEQAWVMMNYLISRHSNQHHPSEKLFADYAADIARLKVA